MVTALPGGFAAQADLIASINKALERELDENIKLIVRVRELESAKVIEVARR